jgi:glutamate formiminotransferase / 5-formyltetrahydrofolate cyclo-ligase
VPLLAVPNVSEGRDPAVIAAVRAAFGPGVLDVHSDADHGRSVYTLAGEPGALAEAVLEGAREAVARIDLSAHAGVHPHVGAVDVAPIVYLTQEDRGAACAEALVLGDLIGRELEVPVLLYGALARGRTRAELRRGGPRALSARIAAGELVPDFGPRRARATAGATLVAARPPLVAFNLTVEADLETARRIAALVRESGKEGLPGVRALGLQLEDAVQLSFNVEDHLATPLADLVAAVERHARVREAELVGLAPAAAFDGFPRTVPLKGFEPERHIIERVLDTQVS